MTISTIERFFVKASPALNAVVLFHLSKPDLNRLSRANLLLHTIIQRYMREVWDITEFLQSWFPNRVTDFRMELARTGAVATGSQILRFFDRQPPDPKCDLDVLTRVGGVLDLALYLESQGYHRIHCNLMRAATHGVDEYPLLSFVFSLTSSWKFLTGGGKTGIVDIIDYVKTVPIITFSTSGEVQQQSEEVTHKVQLIAVLQPPIEHILYGYHSSECYEFFPSCTQTR